MGNLNPFEIIRYLLSGGAFMFLGYFTIDNPNTCNYRAPFIEHEFTLLATAFIIGAIIYFLHRQLFYPIWLRIALYCVFCKNSSFNRAKFCIAFKMRDSKRDILRWEAKERCQSINKLSRWASQIHFFYSVFLAGLLIAILSISSSIYIDDWCLLITVSLVALILGFYSHYRYLVREEKILNNCFPRYRKRWL